MADINKKPFSRVSAGSLCPGDVVMGTTELISGAWTHRMPGASLNSNHPLFMPLTVNECLQAINKKCRYDNMIITTIVSVSGDCDDIKLWSNDRAKYVLIETVEFGTLISEKRSVFSVLFSSTHKRKFLF